MFMYICIYRRDTCNSYKLYAAVCVCGNLSQSYE